MHCHNTHKDKRNNQHFLTFHGNLDKGLCISIDWEKLFCVLNIDNLNFCILLACCPAAFVVRDC